MKLQLVILCVAVFVSALALPVPDEEVSPVAQVAPVPEVKSDAIVKPEEKQPVEVVKPESRAAVEDKSSSNAEPAPVAPKSAIEEKKLEAPASVTVNAPDSESAPTLSDKKEEKKADKQIRIENNESDEIKALPVVEIPAAGITEQKQSIEELKPAIEELNPEAKSTAIAEAPAAEQKKEELSAAEDTPIVKSEITGTPLPVAAATTEQKQELKKEDLPARQERGGVEEKVEDVKVDNAKVAAAVEAVIPPVVAEVVPAVKSLSAEEKNEVKTEQAAEEAAKPKQNAEAPVADLKSADVVAVAEPLPEKKLDDAKQAAGDISQQSSEEASSVKALKPEQASEETLPQAQSQSQSQPQAQAAPEAKKIEEATSAAATTATATPDEPKKEEAKPAATEPLKKIDDKKSEESKESDESKESAESNENKSN